MQSTRTVVHQGPRIVIETTPLTREAFAPFGDVIENPRPGLDPSSADKSPSLPFAAVTANQGSAIKYQHVSRQVNLYDQAPSGNPGSAVTSMFVCAARARIPDPQHRPAPAPASAAAAAVEPDPGNPVPDSTHTRRHHDGPLPTTFPVTVLERHPYTTQTFIPLVAEANARYLVIVAPTLPATPDDTAAFAVPIRLPPSARSPRPLPGGGLPDLHCLRAFVAGPAQAVTYGAGTWHAPMVALGEQGTTVDFVVMQFANGVGAEDCQEVFLQPGEARSDSGGVAPVLVRLGPVEVAAGGGDVRKTKL